MPLRSDIKRVLVIGSGPIVIGQAAEFDYAGTQACKALKNYGLEVILINSNPATIMTDKAMADKIYIEPLTLEVVKRIILIEKPDSILPTLGGQAALNLAMELVESGYLEKSGVKLIGTSPSTIKKAEDRLEFQQTMEKIGEPIAAGQVVKTVEDGVEFAKVIGYPAVLRPAYTLGGSGGGIAHNQEELETILENGLRLSRVGEVLVERYIGGWKEVEYEVMRDENGTCITICNMENIDPVGVHTGDSIVVAPSQTLGDKEYPPVYDRPHSLKIFLNYEAGRKRRCAFAATFSYNSGMNLTLPIAHYRVNGTAFYIYSTRNGYRAPAFHELNLSMTCKTGKRGRLILSVMNVYNRKNVFTIYTSRDDYDFSDIGMHKMYLYGALPSISYQFTF